MGDRRSYAYGHGRRGQGSGFRGAWVGGFNPASIADLALWLHAGQGITLNGADVSGWADQTANGNDAAQATPAAQPVFTAANALMNNKPSVDFDGSNHFMTIADAATVDIAAAGLSIYVACVATTGVGNDMIVAKWQGTVQEYQFRLDAAGNLDCFVRNGANSANYSTSVPGLAGTSQIGSMRFADGDLRCRIDGGSENQDTSETGSQASDGVVGLAGFADGTSLCQIDIAELLMYQRDLTDAEDTAVRDYLTGEYQ